MIIAIF